MLGGAICSPSNLEKGDTMVENNKKVEKEKDIEYKTLIKAINKDYPINLTKT